ncbi:choice-of-anchor I family protein [Staphylococcus chromogenes]|nr:choice-of-anchor I family protein [Staphylococcus chromogenes]
MATEDGKAYVTLQENNAVAVVDIASASVEKLLPLGTVDHSVVKFDPSDKDGKTELRTAPVKGLLLPDAIGTYQANGQTYFVTANEGDTRDWEGFSEEKRVATLKLSKGFAGLKPEEIAALQSEDQLGRLKVTSTLGKNEATGTYDELYSFGGRGFTIFDAQGNRVFESGSEFEEILSGLGNQPFNPDHTSNDADDRSDDKGAEPEGLTLGTIGDRTFAFIGLERTSGIMVYDVTDPKDAAFVTYLNNRDFAEDPASGKAGDLGPEGLTFIPAQQSPNGKPMLAVGNEVSGTTTLYQINADKSLIDKPATSSTSSKGSSAGSSTVGLIASLAAVIGLIAAALPHLGELHAQWLNLLAMLQGRR